MRNFLRGVLYQALVEKLCPDCSLPAEQYLAEDKLALLVQKFDLDTKKLWVRHQHDKSSGASKCLRCNGQGVLGRTVVCELVVPSAEVLTLLQDGQVVRAESAWRATREARFDEPGTKGKTYVEHAIYKATQREVCAQSLFFLENLWNYEVVGLKSHSAELASGDKGDRSGASVVSLDHGRVGKVAGAAA
jgi:type II secretory ATPase GspE/PulE/Tfp pilus assembly ATPase PilB-like protein